VRGRLYLKPFSQKTHNHVVVEPSPKGLGCGFPIGASRRIVTIPRSFNQVPTKVVPQALRSPRNWVVSLPKKLAAAVLGHRLLKGDPETICFVSGLLLFNSHHSESDLRVASEIDILRPVSHELHPIYPPFRAICGIRLSLKQFCNYPLSSSRLTFFSKEAWLQIGRSRRVVTIPRSCSSPGHPLERRWYRRAPGLSPHFDSVAVKNDH